VIPTVKFIVVNGMAVAQLWRGGPLIQPICRVDLRLQCSSAAHQPITQQSL